MEITAKARIHIVAPDGELLETIELQGYDLRRHAAAASLIDDIAGEIEKYELTHK